MPAGCKDPVQQREVAEAPVRRKMVEAARVVDQVVQAAQHRPGQRERVTAVETHRRPGLAGPLLGPGDGGGGEVDGVHGEPPRGQVPRVAPRTAPEVEDPAARGDHAPVEPLHEVLVRLVHEERHRPGPVRVERVPPVGRPVRPAVGARGEQVVQEPQHIVDVSDSTVHQIPFPDAETLGRASPKAQFSGSVRTPRTPASPTPDPPSGRRVSTPPASTPPPPSRLSAVPFPGTPGDVFQGISGGSPTASPAVLPSGVNGAGSPRGPGRRSAGRGAGAGSRSTRGGAGARWRGAGPPRTGCRPGGGRSC